MLLGRKNMMPWAEFHPNYYETVNKLSDHIDRWWHHTAGDIGQSLGYSIDCEPWTELIFELAEIAAQSLS